jgi:hypothetical protein
MKINSLLFLLCAVVMILACSPKATTVLKKDVPEKNIKMNKLISYNDGNNNVWEIDYAAIQYKPVTKQESSSGLYSGGKNRNIIISPEQYSELQELAQAALNDKSGHIGKRQMGSALLNFEEGQLILDMNANIKNKIEEFLRNL